MIDFFFKKLLLGILKALFGSHNILIKSYFYRINPEKSEQSKLQCCVIPLSILEKKPIKSNREMANLFCNLMKVREFF